MLRLAVGLLGLVASTSGSEATDMNAGARRAIESAVERFREAYNTGNVGGIAGYYSDSLVKLRQGAPPEGKAEVIRRITDSFRQFRGHLDVTNDEIEVSGDLAFTRGSLMVTLTPRSGDEAHVVKRRFLEIWRREGDRWRVYRTMDNAGD